MSINLDEADAGKTLSKKDIKAGESLTLQINDIEMKNMAKEGEAPDVKPYITWATEDPITGLEIKPMSLNKTNLRMLNAIHGPKPEDYLGKFLTVWHDPSVKNPGQEVVGGLRFKFDHTTD